MKTCHFFYILFIASVLVFTFSCTKDDPQPDNQPVEINADNSWVEDEISLDEVLWYKVIAEETYTTLYIEWAEADYHGTSRSYTGDIMVSAYKLDGSTPYFENKNKGYGGDIRSFPIEDEHSVLLKVELNDETRPGTFAIRSTGTSGSGDITYKKLDLGSSWTDGSIIEGETIGYEVDCGNASKVKIIWAETDSPESGYTAEIKGSVFHLDGETAYQDLGNGKDIINKNKSHSDDPKYIEVDPAEKKIKIHIMVNTLPGTYAIKVEEMQ